MMKFFRKHMRELLAVFMALLLVVWLGGTALQNVLRKRYSMASEQRGVAFGQPVLFRDMEPAFQDANILSRMGIRWQMPWIDTVRMMGIRNPRVLETFVLAIRAEPLDEVEWYMLDAAARHAGIYVPPEAVERFKRMYGIQGVVLDRIREGSQLSLSRIDQAIRSYVRVLEAVELDNRGIKPTEADIQDFIRKTQEKVRAAFVVLDSAALEDATSQPSESELKAQFEKGKDRDRVPGDVLGFGYREPEKAQVEYIRINVDALARLQKVTDEEAYGYWLEHKDEFLRPAPATSPTAAQTRPAEREPYETFSEARAAVVDKLSRDKAKAEALRLARELIARLDRPWRQIPATGPGSESPFPSGADSPDVYPQVIASLEARYPGVFEYGRTLLTDAAGLSANPKVGRVRAQTGRGWPIPLAQVAFMIEGREESPEKRPETARLFRKLYRTCSEPLVDDQNNAYVIRTVALRPKQPPKSWEQVRDKLVEDIRRSKAYQRAGELARRLAERAEQVGLKAALEADGDLKKRLGQNAYSEPKPFARQRLSIFGGPPSLMPNWIPMLGMDEALIDRCFAVAAGTATQPAGVFVHEQPRYGRWIVAQVLGLVPVTQEQFDRQRQVAYSYTSTDLGVRFLRTWFDSQQIRERIGWQDVLPEKARKNEQDTQPAAGAVPGDKGESA